MWLYVFYDHFWIIFRTFGIPNLWTFGIVCGPLVYFSRFGMLGPIFLQKNLATLMQAMVASSWHCG
jgi:hypothetical protein